ncbi:hypothetical protein [Variovorax sp. UC122_21]|uniref:hypothetical protein n=1 Tax=Variovorax sp. UC122_21 TaxID=3374554 RepID=UPI0037582F2A
MHELPFLVAVARRGAAGFQVHDLEEHGLAVGGGFEGSLHVVRLARSLVRLEGLFCKPSL